MAGTSSIGGLASGLDTAAIIEQLMSLEAISQSRLKTKVATEETKVTALQRLNTALQSLATAATAMSATTGAAAWSTLSATSSNSAVSVTAASTAAPGGFTVTVNQTALSHQLAFTDARSRTEAVTGASNQVVLKRAGEPDLQIDTANGTLEELAAAINSADAGVRATLVRTGATGGVDQYRLLVESATTGADQAFELTDSTGAALLGGASVRAGRDASIEIGGIAATSTSNVFADVVPGVTITLGASATGTADLTIGRDPAAASDKAKAFVDQVNALLTQIHAVTANSQNGKGTLAGDNSVRKVASSLQDAIYPGDGTSMAAYGVQVDRYGKLTFDADKFAAAYAADPVAAAAAFTGTDGFAARVTTVAESASDKYTGSVTSAINNRTTTISRLNQSIDDWDDRLELRRATLERQYTALETALSSLQAQSSWLTSQLDSLSSSTK